MQKFGHDFVHGDIFTKLSFFVWGLGYIGHGQLMKRFWSHLYRALRCISWHSLAYPTWQKFGTLGTVKNGDGVRCCTMKNVVNDYDNSFEILLMSMIAFYRDRGTDRGGHDGGIFQLSAAEDP